MTQSEDIVVDDEELVIEVSIIFIQKPKEIFVNHFVVVI